MNDSTNFKLTNILLCSLMFIFLGCSAKSEEAPPSEDPKPPILKGDVKLFVTTNTRSKDFEAATVDFGVKSNLSPSTITINPTERFQTMDGFGAAVTGSTSYNLMQMKAEDRRKFLEETFSEEKGMGQSYIRISIGGSDFSLSEYTLWDVPGEGNFALQKEEIDYVIPVLKEILAINPKIKIMGSPWSSPRWMKVNNLNDLEPYNSWTSGQLNPDYYQEYGSYFVKWIEAFQVEGIEIYSITPQNEPLNRGNSMSMYMTWQEQQVFIRDALGPQLKAAGLHPKIYVFDHNFNYDNVADQKEYPIKIYEDAKAAAFITGAAYHNYGGDKNELLHIHQKQPDKELVFTETSIGTWNDGRNLDVRLMEDMQEVGLGTVNNWSRAFILWNLMLDSERGPNRDGGCQTCYGAVDINKSDYKTIIKNSHYYVAGHFSSVVKPGATRIGTKGYKESGISYAAFENLNGTYAMVLQNNTKDSKKITISDGNQYFTYEVPSKSVVSYQWHK